MNKIKKAIKNIEKVKNLILKEEYLKLKNSFSHTNILSIPKGNLLTLDFKKSNLFPVGNYITEQLLHSWDIPHKFDGKDYILLENQEITSKVFNKLFLHKTFVDFLSFLYIAQYWVIKRKESLFIPVKISGKQYGGSIYPPSGISSKYPVGLMSMNDDEKINHHYLLF